METRQASLETERAIRDRIVTGVIPADTWLRESTIAGELGVSRTPVREACNRLARDGLLEWEPKRGFRSLPLDATELHAAYPVLIALEVLAIESIHGTTEDLAADLTAPEMRLTAASNQVSSLYQIDRAWHRRLVGAAGNPILSAFHDQLLERVARYIHAYWYRPSDIGRSDREHEQICEALERSDFQLAAALIRSHRRSGLERIDRLMG